jgi:hypothetical protein
MPRQPETTTTSSTRVENTASPTDPAEYRKMVEQVAEKVWALWREELRRERERRGMETR